MGVCYVLTLIWPSPLLTWQLSYSFKITTMATPKLKAAILVVSDTAFADPSTDKAGSILEGVFSSEGADAWTLEYCISVPDSVGAIQDIITQFCDDDDDFMNVVVTTGGTGFAAKDYTPEAIKPLLDREAPGLV